MYHNVTKYNFGSHTPLEIDQKTIDESTVIICFTNEHIEFVLSNFKLNKDKVFLFSDVFSIPSFATKDISYDNVTPYNKELHFNIASIIQAVESYFSSNLSVIVPVFNEEKNIYKLTNKILSQINDEDELIIVSSGSTDKTDKIVSEFLKKNRNLKLLKQVSREGKISAIKYGLIKSTNTKVLLLDGDVDISKDYINRIKAHDDNICFTGKVVSVDGMNLLLNKINYISASAWNFLREKILKNGKFLYPSGYTMVLPRRFLEFANDQILNTIVNDDAMIAIVLYKYNVKFVYNPQVRVLVKFPDNFSDFYKQKIRTRIGRRQEFIKEFKQIEKSWEREIYNFIFTKYAPEAVLLLILNYILKIIAKVKSRSNKSYHLWEVIKTTK